MMYEGRSWPTVPFTPFHFGPGLLVGVPLRRRLDPVTFLVANVLVDVRATLVFFNIRSGPLHGPLHTYLGALGLAVILTGSVLVVTQRIPNTTQWTGYRPASVTAVALASVAGTWLHVTLDAILYSDMQPLYPVLGNPLYGLTGTLTIYGACTLALFLGAIASVPPLWRRWRASSA